MSINRESFPQLQSLLGITIQSGKSLIQGMDFSNLEQSAMVAINQGQVIHKSIDSSTYTSKADDVYDAMANLMKVHGHTQSSLWADYLYDPRPEPHCKAKAFEIIDKFWSKTELGLYGQYIAQLDKNPKSKDVFKGRSTTHHYPWYKRGTKY